MHDHDGNTRRVRTLIAEVDTADAMMTLVKYSRDAELIRKYQEVALRSYLSAIDLVAIGTLTRQEENDVWCRLTPVMKWLQGEGLLK